MHKTRKITLIFMMIVLFSLLFGNLASGTGTLNVDRLTTWDTSKGTQIRATASADVDRDGQGEIVTVGVTDLMLMPKAQLCVWDAVSLTIENVKTWYWTSATYINSVAVGDVDADGQIEIVTGGTSDDGRSIAQLCVWNGATLALENVRTWYWTSHTVISSVTIGNVDGDNQDEIITGGYYKDGTRDVAQLCTWNGINLALENVRTWYWTGNTRINSVFIGNPDGDTQAEIVTGGYYDDGTRNVAQLCVWNGANLVLENVRVWYWGSGTYLSSVAIGNVDGDSQIEVVTGGSYSDGTRSIAQLCVWNGANLGLENVKTWYWTDDTSTSSVAVGNIDSDTQLEIVTGGDYYDGSRNVAQLCVWSGTDLALENFKTWYWTSITYISSITIRNVDGDSQFEIITGGYYFTGVYQTGPIAQLIEWVPAP